MPKALTEDRETVELARRVLEAALDAMMRGEQNGEPVQPVDALIRAAHLMPSPKWAYRSAFRVMRKRSARATFQDMLRTARWCARQET